MATGASGTDVRGDRIIEVRDLVMVCGGGARAVDGISFEALAR